MTRLATYAPATWFEVASRCLWGGGSIGVCQWGNWHRRKRDRVKKRDKAAGIHILLFVSKSGSMCFMAKTVDQKVVFHLETPRLMGRKKSTSKNASWRGWGGGRKSPKKNAHQGGGGKNQPNKKHASWRAWGGDRKSPAPRAGGGDKELVCGEELESVEQQSHAFFPQKKFVPGIRTRDLKT
jgi:hypothetical protein